MDLAYVNALGWVEFEPRGLGLVKDYVIVGID